MRLLHHLWLTVYCKEEDNEEEILKNLRKFFPFSLEEEKIKIKRKSATGFEDKKIIIFQVHLEKASHLNKFIDHLKKILNDEQKELLSKQLGSRIDDHNHFFIRLDKDKLIKDNVFWITDEGNCYHLKMSVAAFPTSKENAIMIIKEILGSNI